MSKGQGQKISIKFNKDLIGDPSGWDPPAWWQYSKITISSIIASSTYGNDNTNYGATRLIDNNLTTGWLSYTQSGTDILTITLSQEEILSKFRWYIENASYAIPIAFNIQGSNDNVTYDTVMSGTTTGVIGWHEFEIENTILYKYYKINFTQRTSSSYIRITELELYKKIPDGNRKAFTITGKEFNYVPNGQLLASSYIVNAVDRRPSDLLATFNLASGVFSDTMQLNGLRLARNEIIEDFEDDVYTVTIDGAWVRSNVSAQSGVYALKSANNGVPSSSGISTITFNSFAGAPVTWWYKVSSQSSYDKLSITLNGVTIVNGISGNGMWLSATGTAVNGTNTIVVTYTKNATTNTNLDAGFFDSLTYIGSYKNSGYYISPAMNLQNITVEPRICYNAVVPANTALSIYTTETSLSTLSGDEIWTIRTDKESLPDISYGTDKYLWVKVVLSTSEILSLSPIINNIYLETAYPLQNTIILTMDSSTKFENNVGPLTITYDSNKGNLTGTGGKVASFTQDFLPLELIQKPDQNTPEIIDLTISATSVLKKIVYIDNTHTENINIDISALGALLIP